MARIWLVGQKSFGAEVYRQIVWRSKLAVIVGVTAPDGDKLANAAGWDWRSSEIDAGLIERLNIDVIVNAHGHVHISREAREAAKFGAIGYHPSLLPRHRGRSAVEWTIASGDPIAGGTVYQLDNGYDTGPIIAQDWCHVDPEWTASILWRERLFPMGVELLTQAIAGRGRPDRWPARPGKPQDERFATYEAPWDPNVPSVYQANQERRWRM